MGGRNCVGILKRRARAGVFLLLAAAFLLPVRPVLAGTPEPNGPEPALIADIRKGSPDSSPADMMTVGNALFFSAYDENDGRELFITVPPYNSVREVADICAGGCSSNPTYLSPMGTTLFFSATDGKKGYELWRTEPPYNQASTFLVEDINPKGDSNPREMTPIGDAVFFSADGGKYGRELWRAQSPYQEAIQVADIFPGNGSSNPHDLNRVGWMLFFEADDSTGTNLWWSTPAYTMASTKKVVDLNPKGSDNVKNLMVDGGLRLFFSATDGESGQELWTIDSPYNEAERVTDVLGTAASSNPEELYMVGDSLFFSATIGFVGRELFRSEPPYDATHTYLIKDINPGFTFFPPAIRIPNSANPKYLTAIGSSLFYAANDGEHGTELWQTFAPYDILDNTWMVMDIREGPASSNPSALIAVGTTLFFTANDGEHGAELWKSEPPYDSVDTSLVADINPGGKSSIPHNNIAIDRTLFFAATKPDDGKELFRYGGAFAMPATGFAPNRVTRVKAQPAEKSYRSLDEMSLEIPALQTEVPVLGVPVSADGWDLSWLSNQVGYLTGTAYPTWNGNSVLTAHVYLADGSPGPFAELNRMGWGSQVVVRAYGERYLYEVREVKTVAADDTAIVFQHEERPWLTLVTCQGYDPERGDYRSRLVVRAVLVKVETE